MAKKVFVSGCYDLLHSGHVPFPLTFIATLIVVVCSGRISLIAFFALYLGESIMFPTIFSLALRDAGTQTKLASSLLIMTIVGGAIAPVLMGYIADTTGSMYPRPLIGPPTL